MSNERDELIRKLGNCAEFSPSEIAASVADGLRYIGRQRRSFGGRALAAIERLRMIKEIVGEETPA